MAGVPRLEDLLMLNVNRLLFKIAGIHEKISPKLFGRLVEVTDHLSLDLEANFPEAGPLAPGEVAVVFVTRRAAGLGKAEWRPAKFWREESDVPAGAHRSCSLEASGKTAAGVFKVLRCGQRDRSDGLAKSAAHVVMVRAVEVCAYGARVPGLRPAAVIH